MARRDEEPPLAAVFDDEEKEERGAKVKGGRGTLNAKLAIVSARAIKARRAYFLVLLCQASFESRTTRGRRDASDRGWHERSARKPRSRRRRRYSDESVANSKSFLRVIYRGAPLTLELANKRATDCAILCDSHSPIDITR